MSVAKYIITFARANVCVCAHAWPCMSQIKTREKFKRRSERVLHVLREYLRTTANKLFIQSS